MIPVVQAKKTQAIVSDSDYRHIIHTYNYPPDSINVELAKKSYNIQSDVSIHTCACLILCNFKKWLHSMSTWLC